MSEAPAGQPGGTCLVVMGFGKKTDFETGRTLDLDKSYKLIIKPAVTDAGLKCVRADEIPHSGVIDVPMYEHLLNADVVIADLSASNKNAYYELGVRHALRPHTTIVICEDGAKSFPFDVNTVLIRQYHHLGDMIDFEEAMRFRQLLTESIVRIMSAEPRQKDSPVYTFLHGLRPPSLNEAAQAEAVQDEAKQAAPGTPPVTEATHSALMQQADEAQRRGDFAAAKALLSSLRAMGGTADPNRVADPYVIQRLALATYKSKQPTPQQALEEARALLVTLQPATANDPETLGLWGAVHKRLWDLTGDVRQLDEAVRGYERGFYLRNDSYNGINHALLLNVRAAAAAQRAEAAQRPEEVAAQRAEAVADFVQAARVRREVLLICQSALDAERLADEQKYWVLATMAEAHLGVGDEAAADQKLREAHALDPAQWMKDSTQEQMDKLRRLMADSPLKYLTADAA
jgi:MAP3K TRAFs-binding domain